MTVSIAITIFGARNETQITDGQTQFYNNPGNQRISDTGGRTMVKFASY